MKKIAFMFAAAAMFAACGNAPEKPATEETEGVDTTVVETAVVTVDSAAVYEILGDIEGLDEETVKAKFDSVVATLNTACCEKDSCAGDSCKKDAE